MFCTAKRNKTTSPLHISEVTAAMQPLYSVKKGALFLPYEEKRPVMPQRLLLTDRSLLEVTGVQEVLHFDDQTVQARTVLGEMEIKGAGLHIDSLNLDSGQLCLSGRVNSVEYGAQQEQRGFFARLFG